jgi:hypothetical protein
VLEGKGVELVHTVGAVERSRNGPEMANRRAALVFEPDLSNFALGLVAETIEPGSIRRRLSSLGIRQRTSQTEEDFEL